MTDANDRASEQEAVFLAQCLQQQREKAALAPKDEWQRLSAVWCKGLGCSERIPDARREAIPGVQLCIECQSDAEQLRRLHT